MNDLAIARAIHVLAVVVWIGGVTMVTTVILPVVRRRAGMLMLLEAVERPNSPNLGRWHRPPEG
jgi:uncharacterized membrane protein